MKKLFRGFYKFIDKCIVVPISRGVYNVQNIFKKNSGFVEKILNRPTFLIYLSLVLSVVLFVLTDTKVINLGRNNAEVISNVPVTLKYNKEAYVVEGAPEVVDITISGKKSDIYLAKQLGEFEVTLDLTDYSSSDTAYKAYFTYSKNVNGITYKLDPSYVSVLIRNKVSSTFLVEYELINDNKLDNKLSVKSVKLDKNEVVVKGSEQTLAKIAKVKALVDLSDESLTDAGSHELENTKLVAYDNQGKIIENVEIVPSVLTANVVLDKYSINVPVEIKTTGNLVAGKSIASILINNAKEYTVTVYGTESEISSLTSLPVTINVDGAGNSSVEKYNVTISKPSGVRYMSTSNLNVSLTFGTEEQKQLTITNISKKNLSNGLSANIISDGAITVTAKGVSSVINSISEKDIMAYVDLSSLTAGDHEVEVKIDNNNPLVKYVVSSKIKVKISND